MQVLLAEEYGFCFGVERAVEMVEGALSEGATVRTLGPLIHNTQEIQRLEAEGVRTIDTPGEVSGGLTAVIRAHGVTPEVQRELESRADRVIDATCPFVTKVQKLAERAAEQGRDVVVVGNPDHPEMIGVVGYAPNRSHVVRDASEVAALPLLHAPLVVSQTTIKLSTFLEAAEAVRAKADVGAAGRQHHLLGDARPAGRGAGAGRPRRSLLCHRRQALFEQPQAALGLQGAVRQELPHRDA